MESQAELEENGKDLILPTPIPSHSAYDSDFLFSLNHKRSYNCAYNSDANAVASETSLQRR